MTQEDKTKLFKEIIKSKNPLEEMGKMNNYKKKIVIKEIKEVLKTPYGEYDVNMEEMSNMLMIIGKTDDIDTSVLFHNVVKTYNTRNKEKLDNGMDEYIKNKQVTNEEINLVYRKIQDEEIKYKYLETMEEYISFYTMNQNTRNIEYRTGKNQDIIDQEKKKIWENLWKRISERADKNAGDQMKECFVVNMDKKNSKNKKLDMKMKLKTPKNEQMVKEIEEYAENIDKILKENVEVIKTTKKDIEMCLEQLQEENDQLKGATIAYYGSTHTGLSLKSSDIDTIIQLEENKQREIMRNKQLDALRVVEQYVQNIDEKFEVTEFVVNARVPVLKMINTQTNVEVDMTAGAPYGTFNSEMIKNYMSLNAKAQHLVLLIKEWTKKRHIADPPNGTLSSYSYVLMAIAYLQEVGELPNLQRYKMKKGEEGELKKTNVLGHDCSYLKLTKWNGPKQKNSLLSLLHGFFWFYCDFFNSEEHTISIKYGGLIEKSNDFKSVISIEDPFEERDLGVVLKETNIDYVQSEFQRGYKITSQMLEQSGLLASFYEESDHTPQFSRDEIEIDQFEAYKDEKDPEKEYVEGAIRINPKKTQEAFVAADGYERDIFIYDIYQNRAQHGDIVRVELLEKDQKYLAEEKKGKVPNRRGKVVKIIKQRGMAYQLCTCEIIEDKNFMKFVPLLKTENKFFTHNHLFKKIWPKFPKRFYDTLENYRFLVHRGEWKEDQKDPRPGEIELLGLKNDMQTIRRGLYAQYFPVEYRNEFNTLEIEAPELTQPQYAKRIKEPADSRFVFTIDPDGSRDLDDAIALETLDNGNYQIFVYIADVCGQITSKEYREAAYRATSVYMPGVVEHMLPGHFSTGQCSILEGKSTKTICVTFEMNPTNGNVTNVQYYRSEIFNSARLTYEEAQEIIDLKLDTSNYDSRAEMDKYKRVEQVVTIFNFLAQMLRGKRMKSGAFNLKSEEIYFIRDDFENPIGTFIPDHSESHILIEEFMLLTNKLVAGILKKAYGEEAIFRIHRPPVAKKALELMETIVNNLRDNKSLENEKHIHDALSAIPDRYALQEIVAAAKEKDDYDEESMVIMNKLIHDVYTGTLQCGDVVDRVARHMLLLSMIRANYGRVAQIQTKIAHFGLQFDNYTHFTSPIRRFADVLVHIQLIHLMDFEAAQKLQVDFPFNRFILGQPKFVDRICEHINLQSDNEKELSRTLNKLQMVKFVQHQNFKFAVSRHLGVITSLKNNYMEIFFPSLSTEATLNLYGTSLLKTPKEIIKIDSPQSYTLIYEGSESMTLAPFTPVYVDLFPNYSQNLPSLDMISFFPANVDVFKENRMPKNDMRLDDSEKILGIRQLIDDVNFRARFNFDSPKKESSTQPQLMQITNNMHRKKFKREEKVDKAIRLGDKFKRKEKYQ